MDTISYIKIGEEFHPIDAITVNGLTFTSAEKTVWNNKQDALTFDSIPIENSNNPVKSGGVYKTFEDNELVVAAALNQLNERLSEVEEFSDTLTLDDISDGTTRKLSTGIPILKAPYWYDIGATGSGSCGFTKNQAISALGMTEDDFDKLVPSSIITDYNDPDCRTQFEEYCCIVSVPYYRRCFYFIPSYKIWSSNSYYFFDPSNNYEQTYAEKALQICLSAAHYIDQRHPSQVYHNEA